MTNKELIQSIKQLKNDKPAGAPSRDFLAKNREILMMQIKNNSAPAERPFSAVYFMRMARSMMPENIFQFVVKPIALCILVFGAAMGSWAASYDSLPGDALYGLKIAAEKAQLTLTPGDGKISLQTELAGRRLDEIAKIAEQPSVNNKDERTKQAVANFQEHVKAVKITLEKIDDGGKAAEAAQMVDRKTTEFVTALDEAKKNVSEDVKTEVDKASNLVTDTGIKAIEVMVKQSEQGTVEINKDEIVDKIQDKIQTVEDKVSQIAPAVNASSTQQEAVKVLDQAGAALQNQQLGMAVEKLVEGKNLLNTATDADMVASSTPEAATSTPAIAGEESSTSTNE